MIFFCLSLVRSKNIGIIYQEEKQTYDALMELQIAESKANKTNPSIDDLLHLGNTWEVK